MSFLRSSFFVLRIRPLLSAFLIGFGLLLIAAGLRLFSTTCQQIETPFQPATTNFSGLSGAIYSLEQLSNYVVWIAPLLLAVGVWLGKPGTENVSQDFAATLPDNISKKRGI